MLAAARANRAEEYRHSRTLRRVRMRQRNRPVALSPHQRCARPHAERCTSTAQRVTWCRPGCAAHGLLTRVHMVVPLSCMLCDLAITGHHRGLQGWTPMHYCAFGSDDA